jgi:N-acetylglucosaminyldiphosphoundecaprenol N-acetyl-beta-D-mannosaminyltransferase
MTRIGSTVLGTFIDAIDWDGALARIDGWAAERRSRYVCLCNAHSVVTARSRPALARALDGADLALPDGAPLAWRLRDHGFAGQERLSGPDLMWRYCAFAARIGRSVFLYGASPATLARLEHRLRAAFPTLRIAGSYAPPVRRDVTLLPAGLLQRINASGAGVVFVGLGCPKQEEWMALHRPHLQAVLVGVGAAFDFHAGDLRRASPLVQRLGLEWLARLWREPRRLWRRYLVTNTRYVLYRIREHYFPLPARVLPSDAQRS